MALESVTITACANSTPPAGTCVAGFKTSASLFIQGMVTTDANGNQFGVGAASPVFVLATNTTGSAAGSPLFASITNLSGSAAGSPLFTVQNNSTGSAAGSPTFVSVTNLAGSAAGSPLFVSACITNLTGSAAGSPTFVSVTNLSGSAAGSPLFVSACVTNLAGSAAGSPLFVVATNTTGSAAGSPLFTSTCITNLAGSAAGSPLFVSACITNSAGSAAGSPLFASITNLAGSAAGSPLFTSITNLAGSAAGSPLFNRLSDGTDTMAIDSASRAAITLTDGTNAYGLPASPLSQAGQGQTMYWAGSMLTIKQIDLSSSISGCTAIVASLAGFATVIVNATYTTSSCQFIGWTACGNGGAASATVQTRMPFGTNGGMDAKRSPDGYLWAFPSGSIAVLTTTSACVVAGTINYIQVAS